MQSITSVQNPRIKRAIKLHSSRGRKQQERIVVFGEREIERAIGNGVEPDELFVDQSQSLSSGIVSCVDRFESRCFGVTSAVFDKICFGSRREGVVMTAARPQQSFDGLLKTLRDNSPLIAVVDGIEKPGNLGAILRSADGAGLDGLIVSDGVTDWFHPNCIRASVGTCFGFPGCSSSSGEVQNWLADNHFDVLLAAFPDSDSVFVKELSFAKPTAIVLGNEALGLSKAWLDGERYSRVRLPMFGVADSLNVSAAAAVFFYELSRQKGRLIDGT